MTTAATTTSSRRTEANRLNSLESTGPKVHKECSRFNALKHGLRARSPAVTNEANDDEPASLSLTDGDDPPAARNEAGGTDLVPPPPVRDDDPPAATNEANPPVPDDQTRPNEPGPPPDRNGFLESEPTALGGIPDPRAASRVCMLVILLAAGLSTAFARPTAGPRAAPPRSAPLVSGGFRGHWSAAGADLRGRRSRAPTQGTNSRAGRG